VRLWLFLAFAVVPAVELGLLIWLGTHLGLWPTLGIILLTAAVGASVARHEGLVTLLRAREKLERGELPAEELRSGVAIAAGGLLLLTPGYLTDLLGLTLLLPPTRRLIMGVLRRWLRRALPGEGLHEQMHFGGGFPGGAPFGGSGDGGEDVIDLPPEDYEVR
jgi:UPF0716 protein FxsA